MMMMINKKILITRSLSVSFTAEFEVEKNFARRGLWWLSPAFVMRLSGTICLSVCLSHY